MNRKQVNRRQARFLVVMSAICVAIVALAGLAWACTPQARMFTLTPIAQSPRSPVTVSGEAVQPGSTVEIHWNSTEGPALARTTADSFGNFSVAGTVPDVSPGIYYIVASAGEEGQPAPQIARIALEVTGAVEGPSGRATAQGVQASAVSSELWSGFSSQASLASGNLESSSPQVPQFGAFTGIGLLALGSIGLVAGAALVIRRKTRISA